MSVSVIFSFFLSLLLVPANISLFGSLLATFLFELSFSELWIVDWSVNLLNIFIVSAGLSKEIFLSFATYVFSLDALIVTGVWMKVSVVTLLALCSSYSVYITIVIITCHSFSIGNGFFVWSLFSIIVSKISVYFLLLGWSCTLVHMSRQVCSK